MIDKEDWKYKAAKKRVKKVKGFYSHFATWLIMSAFFIVLNLISSSGNFWAIWPIMGWGLGVAFHAIGVFGVPGRGADWEEKMLEREMRRIEYEAAEKGQSTSGRLPERIHDGTDELELKEVRKAWRDQDLV